VRGRNHDRACANARVLGVAADGLKGGCGGRDRRERRGCDEKEKAAQGRSE
jgi:hypothetical protein